MKMYEISEKVHATSDKQLLDTKSDDDKTLENEKITVFEDPSGKEIPNLPTLCDNSLNIGLKRLPRSQKKRIKQELAVQRKKDLRKEKKQLQRQRQRERAKDETSKNVEEGTVQPTRKELKEEIKSRLEMAMMCGQRICIDLSMENTMTLKEKSKLSQQLCRVYGVNRRAENPAHLYFAGFDKNGDLYKECIQKIDGFEKFMVEMTEAPVLEVFNVDDVIYLSPDAPDMLEDLDKDKVYVIGGIVDESIIKNLSKQKADASNIPTFRLPIERFMKKKDQIHFSQVLAVNQVFEILVTYLSSRDWKTSLSKGVPERKGYVLKD